jgi:hypothetical protein
MAGIADRIERFNIAYRLAWKYVPEGVTRERTSFARRLHDSISRQLREGASEPVFIASVALKEMEGTNARHLAQGAV